MFARLATLFCDPNRAGTWDAIYRREVQRGKVRSTSDVRPLLGPIGAATTILDFGGGPGGTINKLRKLQTDRHYILVEQSAFAREFAGTKLFRDADDRRNTFACAAGIDQMQPQCVDCVMALEVLEHVRDYAALLARLWQLVRPGGVLVASVPVNGWRDWTVQHVNKFTVGSMVEALSAHGGPVHVLPRSYGRRHRRLTTAFFWINKPPAA